MQSSFTRIIFIFIILLYSSGIIAKTNEKDEKKKELITGVVLDASDKKPIPLANVYIYDLNLETQSNFDGQFSFTSNLPKEKVSLKISSIGYESQEIKADIGTEIIIYLQQSSYGLQEVIVSAKEGVKGNSVSLIEKSSMQHLQPSSFADLLQLLPGYSSKNINMSESQHISMRQAGSDNNTSLGASFIIDGVTMDNDADLQQRYSNNTSRLINTNKGVDMRLISTDMIESIEVIRGIASAKYGDLTSGVVKIELKTGYTPWESRIKTDFNNTLFSIGKGVILPNKKGVLNVDVDYAAYNPEPRTDITKYSRANLALRHENKFEIGNGNSFLYKVNMSYTGSFDKDKTDPDALSKNDYLKNDYNRYAISTQGKFAFNNRFIQNLNYALSYTQTTENLEQYSLKSLGGTRPLTTILKEEGEFNTTFLPAEYNSLLQIKGKPINLLASIEAKSSFVFLGSSHSLSYGTDFTYNKNKGEGEIYDPTLPPFDEVVSSRARVFKDIPSIQRLGFYIEDNINLPIGEAKLNLQPSLRGSSMLNLSKDYDMQGKFYWEPRLNTKLTFPQFTMWGQNSSISLFGGAGVFYKFPTLSQLYPDDLYFDYVQLSYYSQNPDYRFANVRTYIESPINYGLKPAKNLKLEVGFTLTIENTTLNVTFFKEKMKNGFYSGSNYVIHDYKDYNAGSVINPSEMPSLNDFAYTNESVITKYSHAQNLAIVDKTGIEYTLNLGKIDALYTRIWMNGAWFKTRYSLNTDRFYKKPTVIINDKPYPYLGVYDFDPNNNSATQKQTQVNTNLNFDTHIPFLKMIFSTTIETMWFTTQQKEYNTGMPIGYIDTDDVWHDFTPDMASNGTFGHLTTKYNEFTFSKEKVSIASNLNLKLSKELGENIRLSCYANNLLTYLPDYTSVRGVKMSRIKSPFFGAEINLKF